MRGDPGKLVEHHTHYKEIHGYDKTVWMTDSAHKKLHRRLRKEGKCNIPVDELHKIARAAHNRTDKIKANIKVYRKVHDMKYRQQEHVKAYQKQYQKKYYQKENYRDNLQHIAFSESQGFNTELRESISYNHKTGSVTYYTGFRCGKGYKLPVINI